LIEWNETTTPYPRDASLAVLFEEQVASTPDAIAIAFEGEQLTYRELNALANQLAHYLKRLGVGPDVLVGICLDRSLDLLISLLGITKAGGAYVPLDSKYPSERLAFMIQDTAAPVVISTSNFRQKLFPNYSGQLVCLDQEREQLSKEGVENPPSVAKAEDLAYVIYTSGSTGQPKGACIPQRAVVRLVKNTNYLRFSSEDVFLLFAPVSFDASTLEIWGPLLNGAKLVIFPADFVSLEQLGKTLQHEKVTTLWLTAGLFHQMVEDHSESLKGVRKLLAGGDVLSVPHVLKALRELPNTELINGYGPTENTTFTCCYSVPRDWPGDRPVPIGKPISNSKIYILDKYRQPLPVGVPGELFIGGDGLAREYLNARELSTEKFIPNTFSPEASPTLYRTGDLVRWLADGNIEFLGRLDNQVKIRGFRVELSEIENTIGQYPAVAENVVVAHADSSTAKQLIAYVTVRQGNTLQIAELKKFLEDKLPAYMLPSRFVLVETIPLTANGKIDRQRLPSPETAADCHTTHVAPRNADEEKLLAIWAEVLKQTQISVHDNFFQLGGHSLLAVRVVSRVNKTFGIEIALREVFEHPTIATLAEVVGKSQPTSTAAKTQTIPRRVRVRSSADSIRNG
jgi:amino acid adenylation domain-containing protein